MTLKDWNPDDYSFITPIEHYPGLIVNMSFVNKVVKILTFTTTTVYREIYNCYEKKAALAIMLIALAEVDYLAGFYAGRRTQKKDFIGFLSSKYFPPEYQPFANDIYSQLRNGLMHNLVMVNPWVEEGIIFKITIASNEHLQKDKRGRTIFNPMTFAEDVYRASRMYIFDLIGNTKDYPELVKHFEERFNKLNGKGAYMAKVPS